MNCKRLVDTQILFCATKCKCQVLRQASASSAAQMEPEGRSAAHGRREPCKKDSWTQSAVLAEIISLEQAGRYVPLAKTTKYFG